MKYALSLFGVLVFLSATWAQRSILHIYQNGLVFVQQQFQPTFDGDTLILSNLPETIIPSSVLVMQNGQFVPVQEVVFVPETDVPGNIQKNLMGKEVAVMYQDSLFTGIFLGIQNGHFLIKKAQKFWLIPMGVETFLQGEFHEERLQLSPFIKLILSGNQSLRKDIPSYLVFLMRNIRWEFNYTGVYDERKQLLELTGLASIENNTSASFHRASVTLIAGRMEDQDQPAMTRSKALMRMEEAADVYELAEDLNQVRFQLEKEINLPASQRKEIALFNKIHIPVEEKFEYKASPYNEKVEAYLFVNEKKTEIPLPSGRARIYQRDGQTLGFISNTRFSNYAAGESFSIPLGVAYNLKGKTKVVERKEISPFQVQEKITIGLQNYHKNRPATIDVIYSLVNVPWETAELLIQTDEAYEWIDSRTVKFRPSVQPKENRIINFTVTYKRLQKNEKK